MSKVFILVFLLCSSSVFSTEFKDDLFAVQESPYELESISNLIEVYEEDIQVYDYDKYCYKGNISKVIDLIKNWNEFDYFYCNGCGGGFALTDVKAAGDKILITTESEVVPGHIIEYEAAKCK